MSVVEQINVTGTVGSRRKMSGAFTLNKGGISGQTSLEQKEITSTLDTNGSISGNLASVSNSISGDMQTTLEISGDMGYLPLVITTDNEYVYYDIVKSTDDVTGI